MSQPENTTESRLRAWLRNCPVLRAGNRFHVDYLSDQATEYALYAVPSTLSYRENILGERMLNDIQDLNYIFACRAPYGSDVQQNIANLSFFRGVEAWIIEQNDRQNFPEIEEGTVRSILPTLTVYPAQMGSMAAKYQINIKIKYRRHADGQT